MSPHRPDRLRTANKTEAPSARLMGLVLLGYGVKLY